MASTKARLLKHDFPVHGQHSLGPSHSQNLALNELCFVPRENVEDFS